MKNTYLLTVFNATFNNISVISRRSVLLVEETGRPGEKPQVTDKHYHIMLYTSPWAGVKPTTSVLIGTDCIGRCKSNYCTITAKTALFTLYMYLSAEFYTLSLSHNVVSSTPCLSGIRPYKFSGDRTYCIGAYDARNPGLVYNIMYVNVIIIYRVTLEIQVLLTI